MDTMDLITRKKALLHPMKNAGRELTESEVHRAWNPDQLGVMKTAKKFLADYFSPGNRFPKNVNKKKDLLDIVVLIGPYGPNRTIGRGKKRFSAQTKSPELIRALFALLDHAIHDRIHADDFAQHIDDPHYTWIITGLTSEPTGGAILRTTNQTARQQDKNGIFIVLEAFGIGSGEYQQKGHGAITMDAIKEICVQRKAKKLLLLAAPAAIEWYEREGLTNSSELCKNHGLDQKRNNACTLMEFKF